MRAILIVGSGFALLGLGLVLLIPLPEAGLPAIALGLRLLGRRYRWARAANDKLDQAVRAGRRHWLRVPRPARFTVLTVLTSGVGLAVYVWAT